MNRIFWVARREFLAVVTRKSFLIGLLLPPLIGLGMIALIPRLMSSSSPVVRGEIVIVDPARTAGELLEKLISPESITARLEENQSRAPIPLALPEAPQLSVVAAPPPGDIDAAKRWLSERSTTRRIAVVQIAPDAVQRAPSNEQFGGYQLFVNEGLDERTESTLHTGARLALLQARLSAYDIAPVDVAPLLRVERPAAVLVERSGEQSGGLDFNRVLPMVMGILLFMGVMMGGQILMTSTIEEKSSRVMEVLLSAMSPLELMWGKLLGLFGVSLLGLGIYIALGVAGLLQFALFGLLDPLLIVWLVVFFIVTYLVFGALMLAIGAAVNQIADAQTLLMPVMMPLSLSYLVMIVAGRMPDSTVSVAASFIPPVNTFAMLARMASTSPPPLWQSLLSLGISMIAAAAAVWFAAKVLRIGLLMHGKPPNFMTLLRWARMA
ncbi:MAG: ABC transporter permease [Pseudomonadales bacterium]|jgi:ABC-2 type transport system permease protein|nr:ABC transporter permease [Pseudomonadales bacterium]